MASAADPLVGTVLAEKFEVEKKIGEGGMGAIYVARHVVLEKVVALKVMHEEYTRRTELVERFLHEAKAAARIRQENVVDIYDFGRTPNGQVFMAMELLDGRDLHDELRKVGPLPWERVKKIVLQVCAALQAAHETGVVHRDMKPENIFLTVRMGLKDFVKILDFGIAKLMDLEQAGRNLTKAGMVFGTPEYMAPEQVRGDRSDTRVDVYATGCILYELLSGTAPFRADTFMGVLTKHLFEVVPQVTAIESRSDIPDGLQAILEKAMAKHKEDRFANMNEMAAAIEALEARQVPAQVPAPIPAPAPTPVTSGAPARARLWAFAAAGIVAVAGLVLWLRGAEDRRPAQAAPVTTPAPPAAPSPSPDPTPSSSPSPSPSPSQQASPAPAPAAPVTTAATTPASAKKARPRERPASTATVPATAKEPKPVSATPSGENPPVDKVKDLKDPFPGQ